MEVSGHLHAPAALTHGKEPSIPIGCETGWAQNRFLDAVKKRKILYSRDWTRAVQPVARRYTNWAIPTSTNKFFFSLALQPPWALASAFQFHDHFIDDRTPWTNDQLVSRPLPKHRTTQTQNKHIHTPNIHALCGIRTHDPGSRASEDSTCLKSPKNKYLLKN
jgi:hypothetical protein